MKKYLIISLIHFLCGCASIDWVKGETIKSGDPAQKEGPGKIIDTRGGLWGGLVIFPFIPLPPLAIKYGEETTTVWKKDGNVVYSEKVDTRANGISCVFLVLRCGESRNVGSWGDFLFNETGMYH